MMTSNPRDRKQLSPIACDVKAGELYRWCGCGESSTQPFCDRDNCGKHCVLYQASFNETVYFCNCKASKDPPFCDGSHAALMLQALRNKS